MSLRFDKNGNLRQNITLTYAAFKKLFAFNESRREKIESALIFLKIFQSFGCTSVYIAGSMVSNKEHPGDIDLCIDGTNIDYLKLTKEYPEFLQSARIEKIRKMHKCHFALVFDSSCLEYLDWYKKDRNDNPRGLVKIDLNDINDYD